MGHPFGGLEIVQEGRDLNQVIENLKAQGLAVEGEFGIELTEAGRVVRSTVAYRPREGIFSKIARIVSVKVDLSLKDLFPK